MSIVTKIKNGKFYCGFCENITETDVKMWKGDGKRNVSDTIKCKKCGRSIPQSNQLK